MSKARSCRILWTRTNLQRINVLLQDGLDIEVGRDYHCSVRCTKPRRGSTLKLLNSSVVTRDVPYDESGAPAGDPVIESCPDNPQVAFEHHDWSRH